MHLNIGDRVLTNRGTGTFTADGLITLDNTLIATRDEVIRVIAPEVRGSIRAVRPSSSTTTFRSTRVPYLSIVQ